MRRTLRRGPKGVADGQPVDIPAPPLRDEVPRDTGTKHERLCGWPLKGVDDLKNRRDLITSARGNPSARRVESTGEKSLGRQYMKRPYRKPTQVGEASSLR